MSKSQYRSLLALVLLTSPQLACSKPANPAPAPAATGSTAVPPGAGSSLPSSALPAIDQQLIAERLGTTAQALTGGAVSATLLREGVALAVEGAALPSALRTELVFRPSSAGAMVAGSVELLEDEVSPVIDTLLAHGVRAVGLYSRYLYDVPRVLVLRFEGGGNPALLASGAQSISAVLRDARLRSAQPLGALPGDAPQRGKLDAAALGGALGAQASVQGDAVLIELPRSPAPAPPGALPAVGGASAGTAVLGAPHPLLRARFSGSDLRAVVDGTLVLTAQELNPVLAALRTANLHPVGIVPAAPEAAGEWFSLHFRGKNNSLSLVRALAQALAAGSPPAAERPAGERPAGERPASETAQPSK